MLGAAASGTLGVALTGRNRTGPPWCRLPDRPHARRPAGPPAALQTTDDDDRHQQTKQYWLIRRAVINQKNYSQVLSPPTTSGMETERAYSGR